MPNSTTNFGFSMPDPSVDTIESTLQGLIANFRKLDAMLLPLAVVSNDDLSGYRYVDGTLILDGVIHHGLSYPCTTQWGSGFASASFFVYFPVEIVDPSNARIFAEAKGGGRDGGPDVNVYQLSMTGERVEYCYVFAPWAETTIEKDFHITIKARWR